MNAVLQRVRDRLHAAASFVFEHRTKVIGTIGLGFSYAYDHQDRLGLFIPAARLGVVMGIIGAVTFAIGLYNTYWLKRSP